MNKRTVIITGGTKGIGAAISEAFHDEGSYVIIGARSDNGLAKKLGERALFHSVDITKPEDHAAIVKKAIAWTGQLDVYINNAGLSQWRPLDKIDEQFWGKMIDVNLKGVLFGCQAAARSLMNGGVIINISSMAGKRGSSNNSVYCAAKFGTNGITQALAKELGPKGIRVNAVCPVLIKTEGLLEALKEEHSPTGGIDVEQFLMSFIKANSALGRLPTAEEVANFCVFLASQKASAITGQCINVDCGVFPQ
jgi:NAD(P)-dependent dehydrogenase (short-subunit alcohol dehydrogenase family)